ncbi:MAG: anthranilate/aminodeoxychorismate synthase component II [Porticoccaceae bacterium]|nr:anthranilate/aminodeoxychorismate synthase component II [Porticoccaceae bacterium]
MILMLDNYDSFTYNVVQYMSELGATVHVYRNDEITINDIKNMNPEKIVISPGPCTPDEAGISMEVVREFAGVFPILGICLGHQSIAQAMGGAVVRARQVMHGKTSLIYHTGEGVFDGLDTPILATRYHSLVVDRRTFPSCLKVTAWSRCSTGEDDEIMAFKHRDYSVQGVQFHPESILTEHGHALLKNFLENS